MAIVAPHFEFLLDRGFRAIQVNDDPALAEWGPRMRYLSDSVGVQLHCSIEFGRLATSIVLLDRGEVPPYPIFIRDGDEVRWFHFSGLVTLCDRALRTQAQALNGLDEENLQVNSTSSLAS